MVSDPMDRICRHGAIRPVNNGVCLLQIEEEDDVYWQRSSRESHDQIRERGRNFIEWLMSRPERRLAVVSHSSFMYFLLSNYGHGASETVQSEIRRW